MLGTGEAGARRNLARGVFSEKWAVVPNHSPPLPKVRVNEPTTLLAPELSPVVQVVHGFLYLFSFGPAVSSAWPAPIPPLLIDALLLYCPLNLVHMCPLP